jgi:hypothetical protein
VSRFLPGGVYDVGTTLGNVMLSEGWAEPVADERPAIVVPIEEVSAAAHLTLVDPANDRRSGRRGTRRSQ